MVPCKFNIHNIAKALNNLILPFQYQFYAVLDNIFIDIRPRDISYIVIYICYFNKPSTEHDMYLYSAVTCEL